MVRSTRVALSLMVTFALAAPAAAGAQAIPRGGSTSSGSSSGSSGSSGSSSSGSEGTSSGSSSSSSSSSSAPSPSARTPSDPAPRTYSRIPTSDSSRSSAAASRVAPGGVVAGSGSSSYRSGESSSVAPGAGAVGYAAPRSERNRDGRAVTGSAVARTFNDNIYVAFPLYGPWGYYYPWYGSAFGWHLGLIGYDPWRYYGTGWGWGRYGMWYDPWGYYPSYDPYFYEGGGGGGGGYDEPKERKTTGDIRLKANVKEARVYVDGALYGTVDEFDGLGDHLELDGGRHTLELRADGYSTYTAEIMVEPGKTLTHRASLKKK